MVADDTSPEAPTEASSKSGDALFWAARHGKTQTVQDLVTCKGALVNWHHPIDGRTPLSIAVCFGHRETAETLLTNGAAVDEKDHSTGHTPLATAVIEMKVGSWPSLPTLQLLP